MAAIAARGPAAGHKLLAPEGHASVAAVAGLDANFCFINEHENTREKGTGLGNRKQKPTLRRIPAKPNWRCRLFSLPEKGIESLET
jgi:hypothetical protein